VSSARNLYRLNIALAFAGALAVLAGTGVALARVDVGHVSAARLLSYCQRFLLPHITPGELALLGLGVLGVAVITRAAQSMVRRARGCRRALRMLKFVGEVRLRETSVILIAGAHVQAFCAGLVRPKVYLTVAARDALTGPQLEAVIAHEAHHARRRDPLRVLLLTALADALFFMPALRRLRRRYEELAELAADEAAVAAVGDPSPLAAALLRFAEGHAPGVVGIAPDRVDHLLGGAPRWRLPSALVLGGLATAAALLAISLAIASGTGSQHVSIAVLAAQSCMVLMTVLPMLSLAGACYLGRRTIRARTR